MQQRLQALRATLEKLQRSKNPLSKAELAEKAAHQAYSLAEQQVAEYEALARRVRSLEGAQ